MNLDHLAGAEEGARLEQALLLLDRLCRSCPTRKFLVYWSEQKRRYVVDLYHWHGCLVTRSRRAEWACTRRLENELHDHGFPVACFNDEPVGRHRALVVA